MASNFMRQQLRPVELSARRRHRLHRARRHHSTYKLHNPRAPSRATTEQILISTCELIVALHCRHLAISSVCHFDIKLPEATETRSGCGVLPCTRIDCEGSLNITPMCLSSLQQLNSGTVAKLCLLDTLAACLEDPCHLRAEHGVVLDEAPARIDSQAYRVRGSIILHPMQCIFQFFDHKDLWLTDHRTGVFQQEICPR